ncbi:hypothetical protein D3C87_1892870 [compost metagenome]
MAKKDFAVARDLDAASLALENGHTQNFFQFTDRLGDGGLADMQELGRLHDALLPCHLDKSLQMTKLDPGVDHEIHNSWVNGMP